MDKYNLVKIDPVDKYLPPKHNPVEIYLVGNLAGDRRILRPAGYMENPYIGKDGRDYHSYEALERANEAYRALRSQPTVGRANLENLFG